MSGRAVLEGFARMLLAIGVDLQPGQDLLAEIPVEHSAFAAVLTQAAYREFGARYVKIVYTDDRVRGLMLNHAREEYLGCYPQWEGDMMEQMSASGCAFVRVGTVRGGADIPSARLAAERRGFMRAMEGYRRNLNQMKMSWCSVLLPTTAWAVMVYPELKEEDALEALWRDVIHINRLDAADPVEAWKAHRDGLEAIRDRLNALDITELEFFSPTMELTVGLIENGSWVGGSVYTMDGRNRFMPNLPTEEIFFIPHKYRVNGRVRATMPLNYSGRVIEGLELMVENGRVTGCDAACGREVLEGILDTDCGAGYFGEVALVPVSSPIYQSGRVFQTTLYDENAVCHLALGNHAAAVTDTRGLDDGGLDRRGINKSLIHVDFMVGSDQLRITARCRDGTRRVIMENGAFSI